MYALEQFYTVEWERRVFKKIGEYLKKQNLTIESCFDLIDSDNSQTISLTELKQALIRFELPLNDKQINVFLERVRGEGNSYVTKDAFVSRFWSAFTYDQIAEGEDSLQQ